MAQATPQRAKADAPHAPAAGDAAPAGRVGALLRWAKSHRAISLAAAGGMCLLAIAGFWLSRPAEVPKPPTLADALAALDRGELAAAHEVAQTLLRKEPIAPSEMAGPAYVLGVVAARKAGQVASAAKADQNLLAIRYLQQARQHGFPPGRQSDGLLLLARLLRSDGQVQATQEVLEEALAAEPKHKSLVRSLLVDAYLHNSPPKLAEALEQNQQLLADPSLTPEERQRALVEQAELLFRQGDPSAARAILSKLAEAGAQPSGRHVSEQSPSAGQALLLEGQIRMREAAQLKAGADPQPTQAADAYRSAIDVLRQAAARDAESRVAGAAMYLIGVCYRELADTRAALDQFTRTHVVHQEHPEGFAAGIEQAELLLRAGRDAEAVTAFRRTLAHFAGPERYENAWLPLADLQLRVMAAFDQLNSQKKHEPALDLVTSLSPLFPAMRQTELAALLRRAWGESLVQQAERSPAGQAETLRQQGLVQLRQAGEEFARLAQFRFASRDYTSDLWHSAECFLAGQASAQAIDMLEKYLSAEPYKLRSEALLRLGEAQLAHQQLAVAVATLKDATDWDPRNAATYRARLLASQAQVELGDLPAAEAMLLANLSDDYLTPASPEWRESLFAVGRLLHLDGRHRDAIEKLEEAVARYPQAAEAAESRYLIADSYRQLARGAQENIEGTVVESARLALTKEAQRLLTAAIGQFDEAIAAFSYKQDARELTATEKIVLRNCHFFKGGALFDLGRYDEAIAAYSTATNRYQHSPEVLDAYVQISDCYRRLKKPLEARGTLEQAKVVLSQLPGDASYQHTTNETRQEWQQYLQWLSEL